MAKKSFTKAVYKQALEENVLWDAQRIMFADDMRQVAENDGSLWDHFMGHVMDADRSSDAYFDSKAEAYRATGSIIFKTRKAPAPLPLAA